MRCPAVAGQKEGWRTAKEVGVPTIKLFQHVTATITEATRKT